MTDSVPAPQGGVLLPPTKEDIEAKFDLSIALTLSTWHALTLAVQNSWGGPDSAEKRDWFAGAISELFVSTPDIDVEYLEEFMLNIMNDEFDLNIDDGSAEEISAKIIGLRKLTLQGDFKLVNEMMTKWEEKKRKGGDKVKAKMVEREDDEDDTDWDSDNIEDDDGDVEMDEAPQLAKAPKEKPILEVDEDGFTKVIPKKKR
ncbi:MAG: hypothetical protein MMC23_002436 [Stictis urceolatum]|nr:hypothetical protein [Stictis urceolata]